jgi:hypothetical protein
LRTLFPNAIATAVHRLKAATPWHRSALVSVLIAIPIAGRISLDSGITNDEIVQRIYGDYILAWYRSGFSDRRALSYINLS